MRLIFLLPIALLATELAAQCGTHTDLPVYPVAHVERAERGGSAQFVIPVLVHVYHSEVTRPVTAQQIVAVIDAANEDLRGTNPDIGDVTSEFNGIIGDLSIELRLATLDENGNCTSGIDYFWFDHTQGFPPDIGIGSQNTANYLNIHIYLSNTSQASIPFPGQPAGQVGDHIVLSTFDAVSNIRNLSHEVGHWVGLFHTFGGTNISGVTCDDDGVLDTPITTGSVEQTCDIALSTCTPGIVENVQNIMDYSTCAKMFTLGQESRVAGVLLDPTIPRSNHYASTNLTATGVYEQSTCSISADIWSRSFTGCDATTLQVWSMVSGQIPDQVLWSFPGGTPSTSTAPFTEVTYTASGTYTVELIACHQGLCDTTTQSENVTVQSSGSNGLATITSLPFTEDLEGGFSFPQAHMVEAHSGSTPWQPCDIAGYASANSLYVPAEAVLINDTATFTIGNFDFTGTTTPTVRFKVAGTNYPFAWYHKIEILYRDLCNSSIQGSLWQVFEQAQISGSNTGTDFVPTSDGHWETLSYSNAGWNTSSAGELGIRLIRTAQPSPPFMPESIYLDDLYIGELPISTALPWVTASPSSKVYPNPGHDRIMLDHEGMRPAAMILQDATGRAVLSRTILPGKNSLDVGALPRGMYLLVLDDLRGRIVQKIALQ